MNKKELETFAREPARHQQVRLPGSGREYGGSQGIAGHVAVRKRGCQVLAQRADRAAESWREGYSDYTTNAIESLNSVIRKVIKKRKLFPTDDSAKKVVYLAIRDASKKWTMPIYV